MNGQDDIINEETTLLPQNRKRKPTPLPMLQIGIILVLQLCEPITSQSILPYINQLISELDITGGDERKVGYYAGLIESLFFVVEAMCVLHWSRLSDHIGRKPVLLIGLAGLTLSMILFGLSKTFYTLVISRCLCGLLNGNIGVMKSVVGELTDPSNRAQAFALIPITWSVGATVGPLIGGTLSRPHERFPRFFSNPFWAQYPYFLPCIASAGIVAIGFLIALVAFKETVPGTKSPSKRTPTDASDDIDTRNKQDEPVPLKELFTYPVILSVSNYMTLAFLNIAVISLLPLFLAMPFEIGGLGMDPPQIGVIIGAYGAATGVFQALFFARIVNAIGTRNVFVSAMSMFIPSFALFPVMSWVGQRYGGDSIHVRLLILLLLILLGCMDMAYGCIFMYVTGSAPNKRSLGATNGLSQTTVSIARAIGPALSTSLFSFSVQWNLLGGYAVYAIFIVCSIFALGIALKLPKEIYDESNERANLE